QFRDRGDGPGGRRARPSGHGGRLARQQARAFRRDAGARPHAAVGQLHAPRLGEEGRHPARRFRAARLGRRPVRVRHPMQAPKNTFKSRLLAGEMLHGLWMSLASPVSAEALSLVGFDWLLFDTEHAPVDIAGVQPLLQAAAVGTASPVVRPAWNDKVLIKRLLDIGAQTLLVPFVETAAEAQAAVAATRYPPEGVRGVAGSTRASRFGLTADYFEVANREIC